MHTLNHGAKEPSANEDCFAPNGWSSNSGMADERKVGLQATFCDSAV